MVSVSCLIICSLSSIGVAPNRFLAKIAADMMKPDGLTILPEAELADRLARLDRPGAAAPPAGDGAAGGVTGADDDGARGAA